MSLNRIAASTSYRRSGCRVISVTSSGRVQESSIEVPSRTRRYSGSERPAWRMNQTGVYGTGSLRQARINGEFVWGWVTTGSSHSRAGARPASPATRRRRCAENTLVHAKIGTSPAMYRSERGAQR